MTMSGVIRFLPMILLGSLIANTAANSAEFPPIPPGHESGPSVAQLTLLKFFPGSEGTLVGRFKFSNQSAGVIALYGNPSATAEIIRLTPNQDKVAYLAHVRLNESTKNDWIQIRSPEGLGATPVEKYELYPGEIRYLDITLPNAKNKPKAELLVQLLFQIDQAYYSVNTNAFRLSGTP